MTSDLPSWYEVEVGMEQMRLEVAETTPNMTVFLLFGSAVYFQMSLTL